MFYKHWMFPISIWWFISSNSYYIYLCEEYNQRICSGQVSQMVRRHSLWFTLVVGRKEISLVIICEIYAGDNSLPEGNVTPLSTKLFVNFHKINQSEVSHSHSEAMTTNNHHGPVPSLVPTNLYVAATEIVLPRTVKIIFHTNLALYILNNPHLKHLLGEGFILDIRVDFNNFLHPHSNGFFWLGGFFNCKLKPWQGHKDEGLR